MANKALSGAELVESAGESPKSAPPRSRARLLRLAGVGAAAILASAAIGYKVADWQCARRAAAGATAWHGSVAKVVRSGADKTGGLLVMGAGGTPEPLAAGAALTPGMTIMTDARTRARIAFDDGSSVVLDRATEITIGATPRTVDVKEGALLADIAPLATASTFRVPVGEIRTSGAKLALTATRDRTSVEVMRGEATVKDGRSGEAKVEAGQEAALSRTARLEVTPVNDLGQRVAFGEGFVGEHDVDTDAPVGGLGELRARKPGSTDEKDHAVRLARHDVKVRVVGNLARTEIDETFQNDTDDVLEGVYRFPLPPGAQIERLALEVDGKLVEGAFVDKARAAAIFRGAIHNATPLAPTPKEELIWVPGPWRDPALLEWQRGGRSELRIFPIPKHGSRRVVLAYTETIAPVAGVRRYVYPLPQATASDIKVDRASFDVQVLGQDPRLPVVARGYELAQEKSGDAVHLAQSMDGFTPTGDLVVEYALATSSDVTAWAFADATPPRSDYGPRLSADPYVALALRPKLPAWTDTRPRDQVIVVDSGRAMFGERFQRAKRLAIQMTQEMDRRDRVTVLACDVTCRAIPGGWKAAGSGAAHDVDAFLASQTPDGATDLVGAVRAAASAPGRDGARDLRVVVISDGVASAGYRRPERVETEVQEVLPDARAMVVAVPIGTDADEETLGALARGGGGVVVPYQPGEKLETAALDALGATYGITLRDVELTLPEGLYAQAPAKLAPMRAGGEAIVAARMKGDHVKGDVVLRGKVGGEPFEATYPIDLASTTDGANAFVPRLYAAARIADDEREGAVAGTPKSEAVALSERFAVPSKYTSLLVLESEAMFQAFGIDRAPRARTWTGEEAAESTEVAANEPSGEAEAKKEDLWKSGLASADAAKPKAPDAFSNRDDGLGFGAGGPSTNAAAAEAAPAEGFAGRSAAPSATTAPTTTFAPPPAAPAPPMPRARGGDVDRHARPADSAPWTPRRRGQWMKRQWFRTSSVREGAEGVVAIDKLAAARAALAAAPDSRKKHMELVRLLERTGDVDALAQEVDAWSARDPMDADAISARADVLARRGDREASLRVLGGTAASITEDAALASALALANERAGQVAEACAFRVAAAEIRPGDEAVVAEAVRCERSAGHTAAAARWLSGAKDDAARTRIERAVAKADGADRKDDVRFGDVVVEATWVGGADLDLAVIDPSGTRVAWDSRAKGVRAADCTTRGHETLAVSSTAAGAFVVEVVRGGESDGAPVHGSLRVRGPGGTTSIVPFVLADARAEVARVDVSWASQLVPAGDGDVPR